MTKPRILITSAGGHTGMPAALQLLEAGYLVRAFLRREDHRARTLRDAGAEIFIGNLYDFEDLRIALRDVQRAYHCQPFGPNLIHGSTLFALAAEEAKLEVVTHLGAWNPHPKHTAIHQREQWVAGSLLPWMPNVDVVHLNPGMFAFTYFLSLPFAAHLGVLNLPYGDGLNAPPSNDDIASVAAHTLMAPERHIGKRYRPTGPEMISGHDAAAAIGEALDREVRYEPAPDALFLKAARAMGFSLFEISQVRHYIKEMRQGVFAAGGPTDHVLEVTGREPEDFLTIARRYAALPEAQRSWANKLRLARLFAKIAVTRVPDLDQWLKSIHQPALASGALAHESSEWRENADRQQPSLLVSSIRAELPSPV
ncbi:MAG: NmrA family NAD(P)-binding protein [Verrucomicrobiota bacterium]